MRRLILIAGLFLLVLEACGPKISAIRTEEVSFISLGDTLRGVLSKPKGNGPFPAVVMIHGAAPATRKNYREFTRALVHQGVAVLNYDKRGCGASGGIMWYADFNDLGSDAAAGLSLLKAREDIDPDRLGYWSFGQGGWVMHFAHDLAPADFMLGISTPNITPREQIRYQVAEVVLENGGTEQFAERFARYLTGYADYLKTREGYEAWMREDSLLRNDERMYDLEDFFAFSDIMHREPPSELPPLDSCQVNPTARNLDFNPVPSYAALDIPVLLFYGREDETLPLRDNIERVLPVSKREGQIQFKAYFHADESMRDQGLFPEDFADLMGAFVREPGMRIPTE